QGVAQDYAQAREWLEKAATKGDPLAMGNLGWLYANGRGVAQDDTKAREWLEKAAAKNDAFSMVDLGLLYASGRGVPQDYTKGGEWLEKAVALGNASAEKYLERLPIDEALTTKQYAEALRLGEAWAAKVEAFETKRDGKPGKETAEALATLAWPALLVREFMK